MQANWRATQECEHALLRSQVPDYFRNLRIVEALLAEAWGAERVPPSRSAGRD